MGGSSPSGPSSAARRARRSTRAGCSSCPAWSTPMSTSTSPGAPTGRASPPAPRRWRPAGRLRDRHAAQRGAAHDRRRRLRRQGRGGDGRRARRRRAVGRPRPRRPRPPRRAGGTRRRGLQGLHVGQRGAGVRGRRRPDAAGGDGARGAPGPARWPCTPRARSSRAGWRAGPWPRAGSACATTWPRGRCSPSSRPSRARSPSPPRRAARCTSSTSRAAAASPSWRRRGRRGVDVTCETCPHYLVLDADDAERLGAVAKCAPPLRGARRARGPVGGAARRRRRPGGHRPLARAGGAQGRATTSSPCGAGSRGAQTLLALLYDEGVVGRGLAPEALAEPARRGAGAALRPGAGQGRARGRRRRRRGARRPGGDVDGAPARSCSIATG